MLVDTIDGINLKQTRNGILIFYDNSRKKWLSIFRESLSFGINNSNITGKRWLSTTGIVTNLNSYMLPRNGTIVSCTIQTKNVCNAKFSIRDKDNELFNIQLNSQSGKTIDDLNIDISNQDHIKVLLETVSGNVDYPIMCLEISWRN